MQTGEGERGARSKAKDERDRWKNLEVWQIADELARAIYRATKSFPADELYTLTSQLRRAGLSVPTNIVEGYSRGGDKELGRFLDIALGSLAEVKYLLHFANTLGYLSVSEWEDLEERADHLGRKLWRFFVTVKRKRTQ
jgi:four helix bundle protein